MDIRPGISGDTGIRSRRDQVGAAAMLTRATAGTARGTVVFMLPGAEPAVRLAMTKLIVPVLGHAVAELTR